MRNVDFYRSILEGGVQERFNKAAASGRPEDLAAAFGAMFDHNAFSNRILNQLDRLEDDTTIPDYLQASISDTDECAPRVKTNRFSNRSKII